MTHQNYDLAVLDKHTTQRELLFLTSTQPATVCPNGGIQVEFGIIAIQMGEAEDFEQFCVSASLKGITGRNDMSWCMSTCWTRSHAFANRPNATRRYKHETWWLILRWRYSQYALLRNDRQLRPQAVKFKQACVLTVNDD